MLFLLGPSGSGKTTLLDVLANRINKQATITGEICINGFPRCSKSLLQMTSYVSQEDNLFSVFTPLETLTFAARLCRNANKEENNMFVNNVLASLGLTDCRDVKVGDMFLKGLSGGQKRRLSIGVELIKQPSILFLDEPTSGLDSASAFEVVKHLQILSRNGHTILTTIHQPSSEVWGMADNVLILSKGQSMYFGESAGLVSYLELQGLECRNLQKKKHKLMPNGARIFISLQVRN